MYCEAPLSWNEFQTKGKYSFLPSWNKTKQTPHRHRLIRENNKGNLKSVLARADSTSNNVSKKRPFELNGIWIPEVQKVDLNVTLQLRLVMLAADLTGTMINPWKIYSYDAKHMKIKNHISEKLPLFSSVVVVLVLLWVLKWKSDFSLMCLPLLTVGTTVWD